MSRLKVKFGLKSKGRFYRTLILFVGFAILAGSLVWVEDTLAPTKEETTEQVAPVVQEKKSEPMTFVIGGDVMFDRAVDYNFQGDKLYNVVANLKDTFTKPQVAIVNLEGPISATPIPADNTANNMSFNFPPLTPAVLSSIGIDAVSLANNHSNNNGQDGLANTKTVLESAKIIPIGEETRFGDFSIGRFTHEDRKLSVITINTLEVDTDITTTIQAEKTSGAFVLVFPHWGVEYQTTHSKEQELLAKSWVDAGADLVVGGHPHVIQDMAVYKGKPIFYSLGNLVFDQTFSKETQEGLVLKGGIDDRGLTIEILPIVQKKLVPEISLSTSGGEILDTLIKGYENHQMGNYPRNVLFFGFKNES